MEHANNFKELLGKRLSEAKGSSKEVLEELNTEYNNVYGQFKRLVLSSLYTHKFPTLQALLRHYPPSKTGSNRQTSQLASLNLIANSLLTPLYELRGLKSDKELDNQTEDMSSFKVWNTYDTDTMSVAVVKVSAMEWEQLIREHMKLTSERQIEVFNDRVIQLMESFSGLDSILEEYSILMGRNLNEIHEVHPIVKLQLEEVADVISGGLSSPRQVVHCDADNDLTIDLKVQTDEGHFVCTVHGRSDLAVLKQATSINCRENVEAYVEVKFPVFRGARQTLDGTANTQVITQTVAQKAMCGDGRAQKSMLTNTSCSKIVAVGPTLPNQAGHHVIMTRSSRRTEERVLQMIALVFVDADVLFNFLNHRIQLKMTAGPDLELVSIAPSGQSRRSGGSKQSRGSANQRLSDSSAGAASSSGPTSGNGLSGGRKHCCDAKAHDEGYDSESYDSTESLLFMEQCYRAQGWYGYGQQQQQRQQQKEEEEEEEEEEDGVELGTTWGVGEELAEGVVSDLECESVCSDDGFVAVPRDQALCNTDVAAAIPSVKCVSAASDSVGFACGVGGKVAAATGSAPSAEFSEVDKENHNTVQKKRVGASMQLGGLLGKRLSGIM